MKKIILILFFILGIPFAYLAYDYTLFVLKRSAIKKILVVSERIEPDSALKKLIQLIEEVAVENNRLSIFLVDVSNLGFSFIAGDELPAREPIDDPLVKKWGSQVVESDAIIFLVPNYNNGYPAGIKNAIDKLWEQWFYKPIGFVAYSSSQENFSDMIHSFGRVLRKVKRGPIAQVVSISPQELKKLENEHTIPSIEGRIQNLVAELYAETQEHNYFKQLYRSITNKKMVINIIKFFKK